MPLLSSKRSILLHPSSVTLLRNRREGLSRGAATLGHGGKAAEVSVGHLEKSTARSSSDDFLFFFFFGAAEEQVLLQERSSARTDSSSRHGAPVIAMECRVVARGGATSSSSSFSSSSSPSSSSAAFSDPCPAKESVWRVSPRQSPFGPSPPPTSSKRTESRPGRISLARRASLSQCSRGREQSPQLPPLPLPLLPVQLWDRRGKVRCSTSAATEGASAPSSSVGT